MRVEVVTPEDYMGDVIGDLNSRRGQISTQEQRGNATVITAMVPLARGTIAVITVALPLCS